MAIIDNSLRAVYLCKQKENESLQYYTRWYKTAKEVMESHIGRSITLYKYVKANPDYDKNDKDKITKLIKLVSEQLMAFLYLENADQDRYESMMKNLNSQKSLGNCQYLKSLIESNNFLSNHKYDNAKELKERRQKSKNSNQSENRKETQDEPATLLLDQLEGRCYCCGKADHKSPD